MAIHDRNPVAVRFIFEYLLGKPLPIAADQAGLEQFLKTYVTVSPEDWPDADRP